MFLFCLLFLSYAKLAFSDDFCATQNVCRCVYSNKTAIDLSSVGSPEYPRFYQVSFQHKCPNTTGLFSYNPCYAFEPSDKHTYVKKGYQPCTAAAICERTPGGHDGQFPEEHAIGLQNTAKFVNQSNTTVIIYSVPGSKQNVTVKLVCTESSKTHELEIEDCPTENSGLVLKLISKCACPNGCPSMIPTDSSSSGLSVGSKILIAFFTILLAYFAVGILWNYCNGSQGIELLPNFEFWNELPTLVMEGVLFTCSCCSKQRTYGEV